MNDKKKGKSEVVEEIAGKTTGAAGAEGPPEVAGRDDWESAGAQLWMPKAGDSIIGVYDGCVPFTEGTLQTDVLKHFILVDDTKLGTIRYSMVGGSVFDDNLDKAGIRPGYLIKITFLGKTETRKEGRHVNLFDIKFKRTA